MNEFHGWHGTPNLTQSGKDGVIRTLKYYIDLTADVLTNQMNGITSETVFYNIIWFEKENEYFFEEKGTSIYFVQLY